ncbi:MAG: hypothetical protein CMJ78_00460 [Planctomycetaceae bacterium]|nr:hypothetical protein [Planctomycetaceae bacterium]
MSRTILQDLVPSAIALITAFVALLIVIRVSKCRFSFARLRQIHGCETGAVQSLATVLTLPLFIMIVMFIIQVSELMHGIIAVNYSTFAGVRAAAVWIPSNPRAGDMQMLENVLPLPITENNPIMLNNGAPLTGPRATMQPRVSTEYVEKYQRILNSTAMALAPACPSHDYGFQVQGSAAQLQDAAMTAYLDMVPEARESTKVPRRIQSKIAYAIRNTSVIVEFEDKDTLQGPTYNPRVPVRMENGQVVVDDQGRVVRNWNPHEVGWQDPMTVTVVHHFALLPGPGRFLAKYLVRDNYSDRTASRINQLSAPNGESVYTVMITASAQMTSEGFKPIMSYVQND